MMGIQRDRSITRAVTVVVGVFYEELTLVGFALHYEQSYVKMGKYQW